MKSTTTFLPLTVCLCLLVSYNFMSAQWISAPGVPPSSNTPVPINVGSTTQVKSGNLAATILAATTEVRSDRYCDALGSNCTDASELGGGGGIGYDQTWQVVTRVQGVWYQNSTSKPIMVFHKNIWDGTIIDVGVSTTTFVTMNYQDFDSDLDNGSTIIVPVGHYYRFGTYTNATHGHYLVRELR